MLFFSVVVLLASLMPLALPQNAVIAQGGNVTRTLPDTVVRGETFNATVTFITPIEVDDVQLVDYAPVGWSVQAQKAWCIPSSGVAGPNVTGNKVEVVWSKFTGYPVNTTFTILYKVTVPLNASPGPHNFSEPEVGYVRYCLSAIPLPNWTTEYIIGDSQVEVILPQIAANPSSLAFSAGLRGLTPANQTLLIWNSRGSGTTLNWTLSDDAPWLGENVTSGSSTGVADKTAVGVAVNITGMSAGDYYANITITDPQASNNPQRVPVTLHISPPQIAANPSNLTFSAGLRGLPPGSQTLLIWNSDGNGSTLSWTLSDDDAPWLDENATSGNSTGVDDKTLVGVSVNITGMSGGDYSANITITDPLASNSPQRVPVTLNISAPQIYVTPSNLAFGAVQGGLAPGNQTLYIWNSGGSGTTLIWTLSDDAAWLDENATSGNSTDEADKAPVNISVNITGIKAGNYSANITIVDPLASNSPQVVPVTLHISASSSSGEGGDGGSSSVPLRGDVNNDGVVDERDLTLERGIILGRDGVTENADCKGDGKIDALDITTIKRIILGRE